MKAKIIKTTKKSIYLKLKIKNKSIIDTLTQKNKKINKKF